MRALDKLVLCQIDYTAIRIPWAPDGAKKELNALTYDVDIDFERVKPW